MIQAFPDDIPVENLSDNQLLALADLEMEPGQQQELSELLALSRENQLDTAGRVHLDEIMSIYRSGMVRKAEALREAVARGLRSPISR